MLGVSIALTLLILGPVAWLFYKSYKHEKDLHNKINSLTGLHGWQFDQRELNGQRLCALDSKNGILAMAHTIKGNITLQVADLRDVKKIHFSIAEDNADAPCELVITTPKEVISFMFFKPGVDNVLQKENLQAFGRRWHGHCRKYREKPLPMERQVKDDPQSKLKSVG